MKKPQSRRILVLSAAIAAIGTVATMAPATFAQQRVGGDGRLGDASNRVGSGGLNDNSASALPPGVFGNSLVNGEVTGGKGFSGGVPYFAQNAFNAVLPGSFVDRFVAGSTNVQTNGTVIDNAQNVHLFLGDNRGVNPPSGFISTGAQPGYIPAEQVGGTAYTSDTRLGTPEASPISSVVPSSIFSTGGTQAGGAQSTYVSASSLFGVKTLQANQQSDGGALYSNAAAGAGPLNSAIGSGDRVDISSDIRNPALNSSAADNSSFTSTGLSGLPGGVSSYATPSAASGNGVDTANRSGGPGSQGPNFNGVNGPGKVAGNRAGGNSPSNTLNGANSANGPLGANGANSANGASVDARVGAQAVGSALPSGAPLASSISGSPLSGSLNTGEDSTTNIYSKTNPWKQPKSAYQQMIQRLKAINPNAPLSPIERNLLNQAKMKDIKEAADKDGGSRQDNSRSASPPGARIGGMSEVVPPTAGRPGMTPGMSPGMTPPVTPASPMTSPPGGAPAGTDRNKPVQLNSFSSDEASAGTKELLTKAEDLMRQGKFTSALEEYDLVEQQAPSQPFIQLARANAELGASYYGLAEAHLREAFTSDQALLSAQLDLHTLLGQDKLDYLVKDLKQIAQASPNESRPVFLLSYICYNTNNPRGAAAYLDLAKKREGKPDPFFDLLTQHWDLAGAGEQKGDADLNK